MRIIVFVAALLLAGCATKQVWMKDGAGSREFQMDSGQCRAQAFSVPGAPVVQASIVYNGCMQGKGWALIDAPVAR